MPIDLRNLKLPVEHVHHRDEGDILTTVAPRTLTLKKAPRPQRPDHTPNHGPTPPYRPVTRRQRERELYSPNPDAPKSSRR